MTNPRRDSAAPTDTGDRPSTANALYDLVAQQLASSGTRIPLSTYRVQLHKDFTFEMARAIAPYLRELGVGDLYTSPFFRARAGSTHGYDIVDHNQLNPEIGTRADFDALSATLREQGLGLVLDTVPNHMGVDPVNNAWWSDVLENGRSSMYSAFFDIDWAPLKTELGHKVLLPVLGDHYGRVLENADLQVNYENGAFNLSYYALKLPLNPRSYPAILALALSDLGSRRGEEDDAVLELNSIITNLLNLPRRTETHRPRQVERHREKEILKRRLATLVETTHDVATAVATAVRVINGEKGNARSFDALDALLEEQGYRLSFWRVAAEEINYRRFFDINDLAAIRMENPEVFSQSHRLLFELLRSGDVTALRIDHPDGLWDPASYFETLQGGYFIELCRRAAGADTARSGGVAPTVMERWRDETARAPRSALARPLYLVVEKILSRGEQLPPTWPVHGTSGYEFALSVGGVFVDRSSESTMTALYRRFTDQREPFDQLVYQKKKQVLLSSMASELNVLAHALNTVSERDRHSRDFTLGVLTHALREVIACFPVYRTYVRADTTSLDEHDRNAVDRAIRLARRRDPTTDASVYAYLRGILLLGVPETAKPEDHALWREFVMRFQQLTGPVMAKGLEDTSFYIYNRLTSLNEVGGEPERYGRDVADFHRDNVARQTRWPLSMTTTSTHDTKRGEDVRARISVLSEMVPEWEHALDEWSRIAASMRTDIDGTSAPDRNEEYLLYQTLLGSAPFELIDGARGADALREYTDRVVAYMHKATKEAKVNTSWINADPEYDAAIESFVRALLADSSPFWQAFTPLARTLAFHGMWGGLAQGLLKYMSPGVPDTYQGTELWDFSLVDPDNRRPVDYPARAALLREVRARRPGDAARFVDRARDGAIKLLTTHVALQTRRDHPELFGDAGTYVPLTVEGDRRDHVVAFARRAGTRELLVIAPRLTAKLANGAQEAPVGARAWGDTRVVVEANARYRELFDGATVEARDGRIAMSEALSAFPAALLLRG